MSGTGISALYALSYLLLTKLYEMGFYHLLSIGEKSDTASKILKLSSYQNVIVQSKNLKLYTKCPSLSEFPQLLAQTRYFINIC